MPLYMDIHVVDSDEFSAEDVVKAHMEDLAIQDRYGVRQLKYWVNEDAKTIFCLMQGPDKESCNLVHLKSHGNTACNIIEVSDNEYNLFMGQGTDVNDLAYPVLMYCGCISWATMAGSISRIRCRWRIVSL